MDDATRTPTLTVLLVLLSAMATACGDDGEAASRSDESTPEGSTAAQRLGVVRLATRAAPTVPAVAASFFDVDEAVPDTLADVRSRLMPAPGECRLDSEAPGSIRGGASGIDAGEVLMFTDANGTYASVDRAGSARDGFSYLTNRGAVAAPEGDLVLDIPGGETNAVPTFPAASAVSFPTVRGTPMLRAPLAQTRVFTDSVYRWDADAAAGTGEQPFLLLVVYAGTLISNSVLCAVPEGGEFVLPEATIAALASRDEVGFDDSIGTVFGFGAMRLEERAIDEETLLLMRHMRFVELPRA